jgi:hypothetical protein
MSPRSSTVYSLVVGGIEQLKKRQDTNQCSSLLPETFFPCLGIITCKLVGGAAAMSERIDSFREELIGLLSVMDDNQNLQLRKEDGTLHQLYNVSLCDPNKLNKFIPVPFFADERSTSGMKNGGKAS